MARIIQIITFFILSLFMMSSSCDKGSEGCTNSSLCDYNGDGVFDEDENCACNYDETAAIDDNSCWFASEGCDCEDPTGSIIDCLEICDADVDNDPPVDSDGHCCASLDEDCEVIVVGGCIEEGNCNYDPNATHNDGSCAGDISQFGGDSNGCDCSNLECTYGDVACGGTAVMDNCGLCIGGSTNLGQSWIIKINSIATFNLQDGTSMGADTNSVTLGTSIYALDGYNGGDPYCEDCYIDLPEPLATGYENENNFIRFYFPHDDLSEWDEWGDNFDLPQDDLYFDRDIRKNDYQSLFTEEKGMNWFAIIEPTLSDTIIIDENNDAALFETILDSIYFQVSHLEGIKCSQIKIALDREKGEVVNNFEYVIENNQLGIKVDTDKSFSVMINISNICIQEFGESCPDEF